MIHLYRLLTHPHASCLFVPTKSSQKSPTDKPAVEPSTSSPSKSPSSSPSTAPSKPPTHGPSASPSKSQSSDPSSSPSGSPTLRPSKKPSVEPTDVSSRFVQSFVGKLELRVYLISIIQTTLGAKVGVIAQACNYSAQFSLILHSHFTSTSLFSRDFT